VNHVHHPSNNRSSETAKFYEFTSFSFLLYLVGCSWLSIHTTGYTIQVGTEATKTLNLRFIIFCFLFYLNVYLVVYSIYSEQIQVHTEATKTLNLRFIIFCFWWYLYLYPVIEYSDDTHHSVHHQAETEAARKIKPSVSSFLCFCSAWLMNVVCIIQRVKSAGREARIADPRLTAIHSVSRL